MKDLSLLINKAREITATGLPFMEGKEKVELSDNEVFTVKQYGYLKSEDGDFVVIADDKTFAFGGSILTDAFNQLDSKLQDSERNELLLNGIPLKISKKKSKNGRNYTACEFFPKEEKQIRK